MEGEDRRADHHHQIVVAQRVRQLRGRGVEKAAELRVPFSIRLDYKARTKLRTARG